MWFFSLIRQMFNALKANEYDLSAPEEHTQSGFVPTGREIVAQNPFGPEYDDDTGDAVPPISIQIIPVGENTPGFFAVVIVAGTSPSPMEREPGFRLERCRNCGKHATFLNNGVPMAEVYHFEEALELYDLFAPTLGEEERGALRASVTSADYLVGYSPDARYPDYLTPAEFRRQYD